MFDNSAPPPAMPDWSPVRAFGGYAAWADGGASRLANQAASFCACAQACAVHGHRHARAWGAALPVGDFKSFWGALGCACWAI
jgi:hypothetical protein